ncbi:MAG: hypothetical protein WA208_15410 [Thermoanaerobaculia bacterium]
MPFESASVTLEGSFRVDRSPDDAFPLFSPRGEEAWVPGWKPELIHPAGAEWEEGLVFRTKSGEQESIWFVAKLDRAAHRVTYHRVDAGNAAVTVSVACDAVTHDETKVSVRYTFVGISEEGNAYARERTSEEFAARMQQWESWIAGLAPVSS